MMAEIILEFKISSLEPRFRGIFYAGHSTFSAWQKLKTSLIVACARRGYLDALRVARILKKAINRKSSSFRSSGLRSPRSRAMRERIIVDHTWRPIPARRVLRLHVAATSHRRASLLAVTTRVPLTKKITSFRQMSAAAAALNSLGRAHCLPRKRPSPMHAQVSVICGSGSIGERPAFTHAS